MCTTARRSSSFSAAGTERVFGDPLEAALRWQSQGAEWLHLVDIDVAFGRGSNAEQLADVVGALDINVELSGGIRDDASLERALGTGARRVNVGTAALENPQWCEKIIAEHGDRIAIGLDVRGNQLAARGWTTSGGDVFETVAHDEGRLRTFRGDRCGQRRHAHRSQPRTARGSLCPHHR